MKPNPHHWRQRAPSHRDNFEALIVERAKQGMCVRMNEPEILTNPQKYGKRPPNRVAELRAAGLDIGGKPLGESDWCYWLRRDREGNTYPQTRRFEPNDNSPRPQLPDVESDYMQRIHRERAEALPLFAGAQPR